MSYINNKKSYIFDTHGNIPFHFCFACYAHKCITLFFKTDFIWHVIAMNRAAWRKCISSQAVTARRHICFVKITPFILIFPRNLIRFVRQSCRNLFICLCLFKNNTNGLMRPTLRELHYGSSVDTKKCVFCGNSRLLSCFGKHNVVAKQHVLFN